MSILVIAEHDNQSIKAATLNALGAAALASRYTVGLRHKSGIRPRGARETQQKWVVSS